MQEQVKCWVEGVSGNTLFAFVVLPDGNFLCRASCGPVCGTARILRAAVTNAGIKGMHSHSQRSVKYYITLLL